MEGEIFPIAPNVEGMRGHVVSRCDASRASGGFDWWGAAWTASELARRTGETFVVWRIKKANEAKGRPALAVDPFVIDAARAATNRSSYPRPKNDKGIPQEARDYFSRNAR